MKKIKIAMILCSVSAVSLVFLSTTTVTKMHTDISVLQGYDTSYENAPITMASDKKAYNVDDTHIALQGYSPVSYLDLELAQIGTADYKMEYDGITYYFTSAEQKEKFSSNPKKYLPQYGGFCATGVYKGVKLRPDPNKFLVKEGKYFLFFYNRVEGSDAIVPWIQGDHKKMVSTSDSNWKKLKNTY